MARLIMKLGCLVFSFYLLTALSVLSFGQELKKALDSNISEANIAKSNIKKFAVETIKGVPMITLDGVPTRSRIFWGRTDREEALQTQEGGQTVDFLYTPLLDAQKRGTFHFRFGTVPGTIVIDDFSIIEEKTGKKIAGPYSFESEKDFTDNWKFYHSSINDIETAKVAVGTTKDHSSRGLVVTILPQTKKLSKYDFHVYHQHKLDLKKGVTYRIHFTIQSDTSRSVTLGIYRADNPHVSLGSSILTEGPFTRQVKMAAESGVHFVSFLYQGCWKTEEGDWDWTYLDTICDSILAANPKALLIPRPGMNAPQWWLKRNPEEQMVWKYDKPLTLEYGDKWASPASIKYREAACEALAAMINHLEEKYGSSIAGYHPYGQNTGEWFTVNTWGGGFSGFGVAERISWRKWLKEKYGTDENLRKAWGDQIVSLKTAEVPSVTLRRESMSVPVLDPKVNPRHQAIIDFNIWTQKEMTDTVLALAQTVRKTTQGNKLSLFFYGYSFEFSSVSKGPAASAHYNLRALLQSPDIDIICSPISYFDRQPGGGGSCMLTAESVTEAGKIYLYEDDTRTFLAKGSNFAGHESGTDSLTFTQYLLLRNTAESAIRNFGIWWMDLGGTGWFEDSRLWEIMKQLQTMDEFFLTNPIPYRPEIGVFLDEASVLKITAGKYSSQMIGMIRRPLNRLGAPYGQYLLDDLLSGKIDPPKLVLVLNPQCLTESQLKKIKEKTRKATLLFVDFPGITLEELKVAAQKANVHFYTRESCNVWASGPYVVLHGAEDGTIHFSANQGAGSHDGTGIHDAISGKKLSDSAEVTLSLKKGETRLLRIGTNSETTISDLSRP